MYKFITATLLIILSGCGFKVINLSEIENYNIVDVNVIGEKRINYIIKNNLIRIPKKDQDNKIYVNLKTIKNKNIKEKNIKNEITKYEISIIAEVEINKIIDNKIFNFAVLKNGSYNVADQNSITRNNEKQLILLLSNEIADEIKDKINSKLNDF
tara:strand:+ start:3393 stop:3857 length:465 start_codon:yes stop_codon:yes gene_type:complete